ncbi:MAG: histidine--tRNA ligase [Pseudomonadota bacterium]
MNKALQAVRGMRDVLPEESLGWQAVESTLTAILKQFSYAELQLPLLEFTDLFARGVGEATDIVEKEMYVLNDRDGDSLALRPEGTAGCVRALQEHGLLYNQTQKVFYRGPMFRYEKPQRGRYRQFSQVGAEVFGFAGPDVDAELIVMCQRFWEALGIEGHVRLEINTLGSGGARQAYRDALVAYLTPLRDQLDEDSQRRLQTNPMRILDSKEAATQALLAEAPALIEFVDPESVAHFEQLQNLLQQLGVPFLVNPKLVRGLDYYTHTVFEWITESLGSQGTICGGGRYDGLVERLGGRATPAAGFGAGLDRIALLQEVVGSANLPKLVDIYICYGGDLSGAAMQLADRVRSALPTLRVRTHMGGGNFKKQLKRADGSGADWAVILGEQELADGTVMLKNLRNGEQEAVSEAQALQRLAAASPHISA